MNTADLIRALERVTAPPFAGRVHAEFQGGRLSAVYWSISKRMTFEEAETIRRRLAEELGPFAVYGPGAN